MIPGTKIQIHPRGYEMSSLRWVSLTRHVSFLCGATLLAVGFACAQTSTSSQPTTSNLLASNESSSLQMAGPGNPADLAAAPSPAEDGARPPVRKENGGLLSHLAFEAGGGFTAPTNDSSPYIT
jgi:hypothetical protein